MFSEMEQRVIKALGNKKLMIKDLTKLIYPDTQPFNAGNSVAGIVRRIRNKCIHNKLDWSITSTGGGRGGVTVQKTKGEKK
jgi:hypothetical protein